MKRVTCQVRQPAGCAAKPSQLPPNHGLKERVNTTNVALYARVSSVDQRNDLERQMERYCQPIEKKEEFFWKEGQRERKKGKIGGEWCGLGRCFSSGHLVPHLKSILHERTVI